MKRVFLFLIGGAAALLATAQDSLTIEQAIGYALRNNYDILLSRNDSAVAAINLEYRNAAFLPRLNATSTYIINNNNQTQTLADGSKRDRNGIQQKNLQASLNLNWTLFDGFRMFILRDGLNVALRQGNLTIKNAVVNTVANVIITYYDIVRQQQQLRNVREQLELAADRLRLASYRFDIGVGIKPDVLQAQIDVNTNRAAEATQQALIAQRKQALNQLMNVGLNADYTVTDSIPVRTDLLIADLLSDVGSRSPQLLAARTNVEAAELAVRLAKADRYPTVSFVSAYNYSRTTNNLVINPFSLLFNLNRGFNYGVSVNVPILNNFTVRQQIRQAQLAVNFQEQQLENQQLLVNTGLLTSFKAYEAQKQAVAILDSNIVLARENLYIERERYRLGRTTFIELRQAEENISTTITNLINARYNLKLAETELLRLRGDLVR